MASPDINQKESILIKEFLAGHPGGKQIIRATTQSGLKLNSLHMGLDSKNLFLSMTIIKIQPKSRTECQQAKHRSKSWQCGSR